MPDDESSLNLYLRWTKAERVQHWILAVAFFLLVATGFALKYPESWWAWPFVYAGNIDLRGILHRAAATAYIALSLYHILYLIFSARGRAQFRALMIRLQDLRDLAWQVRRNLGKHAPAPEYGHFTYWEKIEYWALIWGTVVMVVTGLLLWFENISLRYLPLWALDVATVIHLYEAILASVSILVWHFYFVIFDPNVYPLNFSMVNGYLTQQQMEEEHAGELQELLQRKEKEKEEEFDAGPSFQKEAR